MDYKALYKGSQYVAVWIVLYLVVKYALGTELTEIDAALTASVLTLLILITENMLYLRKSSRDPVREQVERSRSRENFDPLNGSSNNENGVEASASMPLDSKPLASESPASEPPASEPSASDVSSMGSSDMSSDLSDMSDLSSMSSEDSSGSSESSDASSIAAMGADQLIQKRPSSNSSQVTGPMPRQVLQDPASVPLNNIPVSIPNNVDPDIAGASSDDSDSSDMSSDSSDASDIPNPSAGATNLPDLMRTVTVGDGTTPGMTDPNMKVDLPAGSVINNKTEKNGDTTVYYSESDYLGEQVIFDRNEFGGTNDDPVVFRKNQTFGINHSEPQVAGVDSDGLDNGSNLEAKQRQNGAAVAPAQANGGAVKSNNVIMMPHSVSSADTGVKVEVPMAPRMREAAPGQVVADMSNPNQTTVDRSGETKWYEQKFDPRNYTGAENLDQIAVSGGRTRNDLLVNQYKYSDFNRMPPSFNADDFEYGYSFLPPRDWYPLPPYPPVCVSNSTCPVQGVYTDTTTMDLKEWRDTQKITPPDSINTAFITNEMNSKV